MSRITGEASHRNVERRQWSDLDKHSSVLHLKGRGEGYVDEVYFGKGFSNPPTFTYSAVFGIPEAEVISYAVVSPVGSLSRGVDQYGMGNDSQSHGGTIQDPGFESQAKYETLNAGSQTASQIIPTTVETMQKKWNRLDGGPYSAFWLPLRVELETNFTNDWAPRYATEQQEDQYGPHRWLQTDDNRDYWVVDLTDGHNLGVGEAGRASARVTINSSGYSNWLIPLDYKSWTKMTRAINIDAEAWRLVRSAPETDNATTDGLSSSIGHLIAPSYPPPYLEGFEGFLYAKADADIDVEVQAVFSCENYEHWDSDTFVDSGLRGRKVFSDLAYYNDNPLPEWSQKYSYRELAVVEFIQKVRSGDWGRVEIELPYTGWRAWPEAETCLWDKMEPWDCYWTLKFRVKGTPGTVVNLDNIYLDRQFRNTDVPILTVGVDEWIRDDAGVYIGAKLWITMGTPRGETCMIPEQGGT